MISRLACHRLPTIATATIFLFFLSPLSLQPPVSSLSLIPHPSSLIPSPSSLISHLSSLIPAANAQPSPTNQPAPRPPSPEQLPTQKDPPYNIPSTPTDPPPQTQDQPSLPSVPPSLPQDQDQPAHPIAPTDADLPTTQPQRSPAEATPQPQPIEVVVEGQRSEPELPGQTTIDNREVRRVPGAFGDAFRAIDLMPGVVPMASGIPYVFIRGATPSSSGYFLDGIRIPILFHVAIGPSVINPILIQQVDVYSGGYPAEYGRYVGGIIAARRARPFPVMRAQADLRVFDAGAYVESPFWNNRANAFAAGRYSYTAALFSLLNETTRLSYWDYQTGASVEITPHDTVGFFAFGSDDYLGQVEGDTTKEVFATRFHRLELRYERGHLRQSLSQAEIPRDPAIRIAFVFGVDRSGLGEEGELNVANDAVRTDVEVPLSRYAQLRAGVDTILDSYNSKVTSDPGGIDPDGTPDSKGEFRRDLRRAFPSRLTGTAGAYLDMLFRPLPRVQVIPGFRIDLFEEQGQRTPSFDPRLAARIGVVKDVTSVTAFGVSHQRPSVLLPLPGAEVSALAKGLQQAVQLSQGVEVVLPEQVTLTAAFFHHTYTNLTDLSATCSAQVDLCTVFDRADGRAFGLEAMIARPLSKRLGGLISYTLSRSERTVAGETITSDFDRTHVLHVAAGYGIGKGWHAGARFTAYSGRPHSLIAFDDPLDPTHPTLIGKRNALRREGFFRLDLRVEKRWHIGSTGWISVVLEGMNVTLQKEVVDFDCRVAEAAGSTADLSCQGEEIGPISIPSLGVSGGF